MTNSDAEREWQAAAEADDRFRKAALAEDGMPVSAGYVPATGAPDVSDTDRSWLEAAAADKRFLKAALAEDGMPVSAGYVPPPAAEPDRLAHKVRVLCLLIVRAKAAGERRTVTGFRALRAASLVLPAGALLASIIGWTGGPAPSLWVTLTTLLVGGVAATVVKEAYFDRPATALRNLADQAMRLEAKLEHALALENPGPALDALLQSAAASIESAAESGPIPPLTPELDRVAEEMAREVVQKWRA